MDVIAAKTRLKDVPAWLCRRRLTLGAPAELREEADGSVQAYGAVPCRMLGRWRRERQVFLGVLEPGVAREVMQHLRGTRRTRVRLVDVPGPFQRGQPQICLSIWAQSAGDTRDRLDRPAALPERLRGPF